METAQEIADRVIKPGPDDEFLVECMARVMCRIYQPKINPDDLWEFDTDLGSRPNWEFWKTEARITLVCDIVMRGVRDRLIYERFKAQEATRPKEE